MTTTTGPRRFTFCRLHVITWLVLAGGVVVLGAAQWKGPGRMYHVPVFNFCHGWPAILVTHTDIPEIPWSWPSTPSTTIPRRVSYTWHPLGIAINLLAGCVILSAVVYMTERWSRKQRWLQFRVSTLPTLSFATATTLGLIKLQGHSFGITLTSLMNAGMPGTSPLLPIGFIVTVDNVRSNWCLPNYLIIPLAIGILCTVYVAIELLLGGVKQVVRIARRDNA